MVPPQECGGVVTMSLELQPTRLPLGSLCSWLVPSLSMFPHLLTPRGLHCTPVSLSELHCCPLRGSFAVQHMASKPSCDIWVKVFMISSWILHIHKTSVLSDTKVCQQLKQSVCPLSSCVSETEVTQCQPWSVPRELGSQNSPLKAKPFQTNVCFHKP